MKNFNFSIFFGCCVIGICVIISGAIISVNLPNTPHIPSSLEVVTPNSTYEFGDYLSEYEVAPFLNISSDDAKRLIESGELDCFMTKIGNSCVFSKIALEGWMNEKLGV